MTHPIIRLVKEKIGVVYDNIEIWNQMMRAIIRSRVSMDHQIKSKNISQT